MTTITDTARTILERALVDDRAQQADLDARRASLEQELGDVLARLADVSGRVKHLRADLGILTEPIDPDAPIPFEVIDDPWGYPTPAPGEVEAIEAEDRAKADPE